MSQTAVLVAGSPADNSRSSLILQAFGRELEARGFELETYSIRSFALEDLVYGRAESETVQRFLQSVSRASAVVFATPVYKATYAGALKLIIDLVAPTGFQNKALLAITTARLEAHLSQVDESFQRLYRFFQGSIGLSSLGLNDAQLTLRDGEPVQLDSAARDAFGAALQRLSEALR